MKMKKIFAVMALVVLVSTAAWAASGEVFNLMGAYVAPTRVCTTTDTSALLSTVYDAANAGATPAGTVVNWTKVRAVLIQATGANDAVISVGTAAVQGASQVGYTLTTGSSVRFVGQDMVQRLYIISKTSSSACNLQVTPEL
jgi:hypothetical protein